VLIDISNPLDFGNGLATATGLARLGATVGIVGRDSSRSANGRPSETSRRNGRCARSRSRC
jgi:NAD(P)-dependent dehydrogenase (short-subunit alcohol dehydrogenase family)